MCVRYDESSTLTAQSPANNEHDNNVVTTGPRWSCYTLWDVKRKIFRMRTDWWGNDHGVIPKLACKSRCSPSTRITTIPLLVGMESTPYIIYTPSNLRCWANHQQRTAFRRRNVCRNVFLRKKGKSASEIVRVFFFRILFVFCSSFCLEVIQITEEVSVHAPERHRTHFQGQEDTSSPPYFLGRCWLKILPNPWEWLHLCPGFRAVASGPRIALLKEIPGTPWTDLWAKTVTALTVRSQQFWWISNTRSSVRWAKRIQTFYMRRAYSSTVVGARC